MHIFNDSLSADICNKMINVSEFHYQKYVVEYKNQKNIKLIVKDRNEVSSKLNDEWSNFYAKDDREILISNVWPTKTFKEIQITINNTKNRINFGPFYVHYELEEIFNLIPDSFLNKFNMSKNTARIVLRKNLPKRIWPPHRDYFVSTFSKPIDNIIRLWISLTEPKFGHVLIVEDKILYHLKQGTVVTWDPKELHTGANLGIENRYFLTIVGESIPK